MLQSAEATSRHDIVAAEHLDVRHPGSGGAPVQRVVAPEMADQVTGPDGHAAASARRIARAARRVRHDDHPVEDRIRNALLRDRPAVLCAQINPATKGGGGRDVVTGLTRIQRRAAQVRYLAPRGARAPSASGRGSRPRQDTEDEAVGRPAHVQAYLRRVRPLAGPVPVRRQPP